MPRFPWKDPEAYGFVSVEAASFEDLEELNAQGIGLQTDYALQGLWNVSYLFPLIGSDGSWQWTQSPVRFSEIYDGETYDASYTPEVNQMFSNIFWGRREISWMFLRTPLQRRSAGTDFGCAPSSWGLPICSTYSATTDTQMRSIPFCSAGNIRHGFTLCL